MGEASSGSCVQLGRPEGPVDPRTFTASSNNGSTCSGQTPHERKPLQVERGIIIILGSGSVSTHPVRVMMLLRWSVLALRTPAKQLRTCATTHHLNPPPALSPADTEYWKRCTHGLLLVRQKFVKSRMGKKKRVL